MSNRVVLDGDLSLSNVLDGQGGTYSRYDWRGYSAYEIAVQEGFEGTKAEWLASLQGATGPKGDQGIQGQIAAQNAWNAAQTVNIQNIQNILGQVVKPFVPNYALSPGYGFAQVTAAPEAATASSAG